MSFFDKMKETFTTTSTGVTQKINSTTDIMKYNTKIKNNEKEIERLIYQVGKEQVSSHLFDEESEHAHLFSQIKKLQTENQSITAEIERIKEEQENARLAEEARKQEAAIQKEVARRQQEAKVQQELRNRQVYSQPMPQLEPNLSAADMKFCPNCGQPNEKDSMFCAYCGSRFTPVQESAAEDSLPDDDFLSMPDPAPAEDSESTEV